MVPEGWIETKLENLVSFRNGLNFNRADEGETVRIVGVSDFKDRTELSCLETLEKIKIANNLKENDLIVSGDLLFVRSNGNKKLIGRCLFFPKVDNKISFSGFTIRGRVYSNTVLPSYVAIMSRSEIVKQQFTRSGGGTNISNLSQEILNNVVVVLPPLLEQRKIAKILQTWDRAITTTEKLIDASKQQKKALMQQLLTGKKRFAGFEGDWKKAQVKDIASITYGKSPKDIFSPEGQFNVIGTGGITGRTNSTICSECAVVIGRKGTIDKPQYITEPFWAIDTTFFCMPKNKGIDIHWFYYLSFALKLKQYNEASGVPSLSRETIYSIPVYVPSFEEQQKIAIVLHACDKRTDTFNSKLTHLKQEKKALMQQLLTGKRRVKIDD